MSGPQTLSRPLAARVQGLPEPADLPPGPDIPLPVIEAAVAALDAGKTHYTDRPGILPLRVWVTQYLRSRFGLLLDPDQVTITCGATEARFVTLKQLARTGSQIACPGDPAPIATAAHLVGAALAREVADPATVSLAYLTPADAPGQVEALLQQAADYDWWILWDISGTQGTAFHAAQTPALAPRVVTVGSFSDQMPGWRVGWMAGSEKAAKLRAYKQSLTICSTSVSQWAALGLAEES
jgi:aspartate/methionine/tyrosine aminotransferase